VVLSRLAIEALRWHRARQDELRGCTPKWRNSALVFPNTIGGPMDGSRVTEDLHRALAEAGLPSLRVHDLRHTAATVLLVAGAHPKIVSDLLGHSTIGVTLDIYSHVTPALHAEAARRFNLLFGQRAAAGVS
jgi:integrase